MLSRDVMLTTRFVAANVARGHVCRLVLVLDTQQLTEMEQIPHIMWSLADAKLMGTFEVQMSLCFEESAGVEQTMSVLEQVARAMNTLPAGALTCLVLPKVFQGALDVLQRRSDMLSVMVLPRAPTQGMSLSHIRIANANANAEFILSERALLDLFATAAIHHSARLAAVVQNVDGQAAGSQYLFLPNISKLTIMSTTALDANSVDLARGLDLLLCSAPNATRLHIDVMRPPFDRSTDVSVVWLQLVECLSRPPQNAHFDLVLGPMFVRDSAWLPALVLLLRRAPNCKIIIQVGLQCDVYHVELTRRLVNKLSVAPNDVRQRISCCTHTGAAYMDIHAMTMISALASINDIHQLVSRLHPAWQGHWTTLVAAFHTDAIKAR
jgi:hypothetical protein